MTASIVTFLFTSTLLAITPGPSVVYTVAYTLRYGTLAGFVSALGVNVGSYLSILIAAFSTSAVVAAYPQVLDAIRLIGALYIFYLAVKLWPRGGRGRSVDEVRLDYVSHYELFRNGAITSLLNPKDILFYVVFVTQFIDVRSGEAGYTTQFLLFAFAYAFIGLITKSIFILSAGGIKSRLQSGSAGLINKSASIILFLLSFYIVWQFAASILS